jgi:hypothetical protein
MPDIIPSQKKQRLLAIWLSFAPHTAGLFLGINLML